MSDEVVMALIGVVSTAVVTLGAICMFLLRKLLTAQVETRDACQETDKRLGNLELLMEREFVRKSDVTSIVENKVGKHQSELMDRITTYIEQRLGGAT